MSNASPAIASLNAELRAADESLVGNEDILRAVLSGCGDCIKILDLNGTLQFMSDGGKRVMEVEDFGSLKGCPWPDFWAGDGNADAKNAVETARQGKVARFKGAADTAKGTPKYWDVQVSPILGQGGKVTHLLSISRDMTAEWKVENHLKEAAERQALLTAEMNHRINNTIAIVAAIASQTMRGTDIDAARNVFMSRLATLSDANKLLLQSGWDGACVKDVAWRALAPHDPGADRIQVEGPEVRLLPKQALSLALAIHELATNATKYGALSNDDGVIDLRWTTQQTGTEPELVLNWQERDGPPVPGATPDRKGFGSRLIRDVLANDFSGTVDVRYDASGVVCELRAPLSALNG